MRRQDLAPADLDDSWRALYDDIVGGRLPGDRTHRRRARRLLAERSRLTDEEYADLLAALGSSTVTELVVLVGYYRTLAQLLDVFDVGTPPDAAQ